MVEPEVGKVYKVEKKEGAGAVLLDYAEFPSGMRPDANATILVDKEKNALLETEEDVAGHGGTKTRRVVFSGRAEDVGEGSKGTSDVVLVFRDGKFFLERVEGQIRGLQPQ